jgi:DoxX-like family
MKSPRGTQTSNAWMIRIGWVLTVLTAFNMIGDSFGKLMPLSGFLLEEFHRLGESENKAFYYGLLQFSCGVLYVIPRTSILGAILVTGFLGGAEAMQTRVSGSGAFLNTLPLLEGMLAWGGIWLRDERLRSLIPLRAPLVRRETTTIPT